MDDDVPYDIVISSFRWCSFVNSIRTASRYSQGPAAKEAPSTRARSEVDEPSTPCSSLQALPAGQSSPRCRSCLFTCGRGIQHCNPRYPAQPPAPFASTQAHHCPLFCTLSCCFPRNAHSVQAPTSLTLSPPGKGLAVAAGLVW